NAADDRHAQLLELDRRFGGLDQHRHAVDDRGAVDVGVGLLAEQHHGDAPGWHDDIGAVVDEAARLTLEARAQLRFFLWRHERLHIVADASIRRADPGDPLLEAIAMNL